MLRDQIGWYIGILVALLGAAATIQQLLKAKRDKIAAAQAELDKAFQKGRESRDGEVALLRSERDDARRDRDSAERDGAEARRNEAEARRTLAMMQRPISDYRLPQPEPPRPRPGDQ